MATPGIGWTQKTVNNNNDTVGDQEEANQNLIDSIVDADISINSDVIEKSLEIISENISNIALARNGDTRNDASNITTIQSEDEMDENIAHDTDTNCTKTTYTLDSADFEAVVWTLQSQKLNIKNRWATLDMETVKDLFTNAEAINKLRATELKEIIRY